jgi:AAA domain/UvrD-like helicase C-terminal domain
MKWYDDIIWNDEQQIFINNLMNKSNEYGSIILNAPAGTGKTTVARYINERINNVHFLAPTHKAASVLRTGNSHHGKKTKRAKVSTIHSFLNAEQSYDDDGNEIFIFNPRDMEGHIIFIDECSMLTDNMVDAFDQLAQKNKIIYMGDDLQLPPIHDDRDGPKPNQSKISRVFNNDVIFTFYKNNRSGNQKALDMLQRARDSCYKNNMPARIKHPQSIIQVLDKFVELQNNKDQEEHPKSTIVLAYSNKSVDTWNNRIRSCLFQVSKSDLKPFYERERLIFGSGVRYRDIDGGRDNCWYNGCMSLDVYHSSDMIEVMQLTIQTIDMQFQLCDCVRANQWNRVMCKKHKFRKGSVEIEFYCIVDQNGSIWYKPIDYKQFEPIKWQAKEYCRLWPSDNRWREYYQWLHLYDADLKYEYAQTVHKSQGSQYHFVYVDRSDLIKCSGEDHILRNRAYYTAISRMIESVRDIKYN